MTPDALFSLGMSCGALVLDFITKSYLGISCDQVGSDLCLAAAGLQATRIAPGWGTPGSGGEPGYKAGLMLAIMLTVWPITLYITRPQSPTKPPSAIAVGVGVGIGVACLATSAGAVLGFFR